MQIVPSEKQVAADPLAKTVIEWLKALEDSHNLNEAFFYHKFPLYRDSEGNNILADALLVSPIHGAVAFAIPEGPAEFAQVLERFEQVPAHIHSRLIRNKALRRSSFQLIPTLAAAVIVLGDGSGSVGDLPSDFVLITSKNALGTLLLKSQAASKPLEPNTFKELLATIDGAKGLVRPSTRSEPKDKSQVRGKVAYLVETAINEFDISQKHGMFGAINGLMRLRGIAGSGKTVVLAMMAAITHLKNPRATILYTFYTKSLYQHVIRLITRFYRQFDDRDPNWQQIHVRHAWGGKSVPGVYYDACLRSGITPLTFTAARNSQLEPFDHCCTELERSGKLKQAYDYVLIDEGQDFPASFARVCRTLSSNDRLVLAYDELQNIFQPSAPDVETMFGQGKLNLADDVVLYRCYRNPREILVCAHAVGFGFYGPSIVQLLENQKHWEDIGYDVVKGDFSAGSEIVLTRPASTSITIVSDHCKSTDIVDARSFESYAEEIKFVVRSIQQDIRDGLKPDDILVISVDDRNAQGYLKEIQKGLVSEGVNVNNTHADSYSEKEFWISDHVTLTTVHKAKGNEAYMVYVVGTDAPMRYPDVKRRNVLFTAMTRAKGWVRLSGVGEDAAALLKEINQALSTFPHLRFTNPDQKEIEIIRRDIAESLDKKARVRRIIEEIANELSDEELAEIIEQRKKRTKKGEKGDKGRNKMEGQ